MPGKTDRILDVWIVETDTVYRDVPFSVVADWVQQGRLLGEDRVRLAGKEAWHPIERVAALRPYLPREEPLETPAASEALAPVDLGWHWKQPGEDEDEDVDMIPLIDISLVLLIFFMMTATVSSGIFTPITPPETRHSAETLAADQFWITIDPRDPTGVVKTGPDGKVVPWYSLGRDNDRFGDPTSDAGAVLAALAERIGASGGDVKVRLRADRSLPVDAVTGMMRQLQELQARLNRERGNQRAPVSIAILGEVSEREGGS